MEDCGHDVGAGAPEEHSASKKRFQRNRARRFGSERVAGAPKERPLRAWANLAAHMCSVAGTPTALAMAALVPSCALQLDMSVADAACKGNQI